MSMQSVASPATAFVTPPKRAALAHIPGDEGWPVIGRTLAVLAYPKGEAAWGGQSQRGARMRAR